MSGWIKIHRKITDWEWYSDHNCARLFFHLMLRANFKDKKWQGVTVQRGQFVTSREHLSKEVGLSEQQIRTCLKKLESTGEITVKSTNKFTLITVENYTLYQDDIEESNQQITNKQPTNNQQITTTKERKERKNEKNSYSARKSKNSFHNLPEREAPNDIDQLLRQKGRDKE